MATVTNNSKEPIVYQGVTVRPGETVEIDVLKPQPQPEPQADDQNQSDSDVESESARRSPRVKRRR
jgi:hypothetical protein